MSNITLLAVSVLCASWKILLQKWFDESTACQSQFGDMHTLHDIIIFLTFSMHNHLLTISEISIIFQAMALVALCSICCPGPRPVVIDAMKPANSALAPGPGRIRPLGFPAVGLGLSPYPLNPRFKPNKCDNESGQHLWDRWVQHIQHGTPSFVQKIAKASPKRINRPAPAAAPPNAPAPMAPMPLMPPPMAPAAPMPPNTPKPPTAVAAPKPPGPGCCCCWAFVFGFAGREIVVKENGWLSRGSCNAVDVPQLSTSPCTQHKITVLPLRCQVSIHLSQIVELLPNWTIGPSIICKRTKVTTG